MITRKRGRLEGNSSNVMSPGPTQESAAPHSSPESDVNEWGLADLFNTDFSWSLDDDPLADVGMQGLGEIEHLEDHTADVSHDQASSRRHTFREMSGQINKNALAARMNRLKKKEYLTGLEQRAGALTAENRLLKQENGNLTKRVEELENETRYLRAVLANESMLAQLLSRLSGVNGLKFSTSLFQETRENDHDYAMPSKRMKVHDQQAAGGVCLHVDKDHVSVEFCTKCAESASSSLKM